MPEESTINSEVYIRRIVCHSLLVYLWRKHARNEADVRERVSLLLCK